MGKLGFQVRMVVFALTAAFGFSFLWADIKPVGLQQFSNQSIDLTVRHFYPALLNAGKTPPAGRLLAAWGIRFEALAGWTPSVVTRNPALHYPGPPPLPETGVGIINDGCQCGPPDSDSPLIVRFERPVKRVGFTLGGPWTTPAQVTLRFYDAANNPLGTTKAEASFFGHFVAVETGHLSGISHVVLEAPTGHFVAVDQIILEYLSRQPFVTYVGQVADGVAEGQILQTSLVILNHSASTAQGSVHFYDSTGAPMPLFLQAATTAAMPAAAITFAIAPLSSFRLKTDGKGVNSPLVPEPFIFFPAWGYAKIQSQVPVDVRAVFSHTEIGGALSEAGIASSRGWISALTDVENRSETRTETALALVNTEEHPVDLSATLYDDEGAYVRTEFLEPLPARGHRARFVNELFPGIDLRDFVGTLRIGASGRVTGVVVRTREGFPTAAMTMSAAQEGP